MSKLKSNFKIPSAKTLQWPGTANSLVGGPSSVKVPHDLTAKISSSSGAEQVSQALKFGALHTKATTTSSSSGSQWTSLLSAASGGGSSFLGGGLLSGGGFGLVGKLLSLFGGHKSASVVPTAFQSPVQREAAVNVAPPSASSEVILGVNSAAQTTSAYQANNQHANGQYAQSAQVIQIVKQALLNSSSLNDVINEI